MLKYRSLLLENCWNTRGHDMNTSIGVHSAEQCNSVILGIPPIADYAVNCTTSPHLPPPLKCVAACSAVAPLASLHVCTFKTSCFIKLNLSVVCDKTIQFDTFCLHELSGTEYVRDHTAVPKHWVSAHFNIHGAYGSNCPGRIFSPKVVTFFSTSSAVFEHFWR